MLVIVWLLPVPGGPWMTRPRLSRELHRPRLARVGGANQPLVGEHARLLRAVGRARRGSAHWRGRRVEVDARVDEALDRPDERLLAGGHRLHVAQQPLVRHREQAEHGGGDERRFRRRLPRGRGDEREVFVVWSPLGGGAET